MVRKILSILLLCVLFLTGIAIGFFKLFPIPQLQELKHSIEYKRGIFEPEKLITRNLVKEHETFLQRLLFKKIQIPQYSYGGGGISASDNLLYYVSNKGAVQILNLDISSVVENDISEVPMNLSGLIESGHPYKNNFKLGWFRVNGVYSESLNSKTHTLFVSHNAYNADRDCITHNISRTELELHSPGISQPTNWETIFTASPCIDPVPPPNAATINPYQGNVSGGIISNFDKDHLLVSLGDYDRHGIRGFKEWAMDLSNPYGKTIILDKNSGDWEILTMGNRNITGLHIDRNSLIWSVENGPEGGDELNILSRGTNYGWPKVSYGIWYKHALKLSGDQKKGTHPKYKKPVFSWSPSVAPRGLIKIEGAKFKYWQGDLIMGTMRDQSLHRLRLDENNRVVYDERIPIGYRVRDLTTLPDGKIALLTNQSYLLIIDDGGPSFHKMEADTKKRMVKLNNFDPFINEKSNNFVADVYESSLQAIFQQNCAACHNLDPSNGIGPHLHELIKRDVGAVDNFNYSQALKKDTNSWNTKLLRAFLNDPQSEFPGSRMQKINLLETEIDSLIQFFETQM